MPGRPAVQEWYVGPAHHRRQRVNKHIVRSIDVACAKADIPSLPAAVGGGVEAPDRAAQRLPALPSMAA